MLRNTSLFLLISCLVCDLGCTGTETGNPDFIPKITILAYSSHRENVDLYGEGTSSAAIRVKRLSLSLDKVALDNACLRNSKANTSTLVPGQVDLAQERFVGALQDAEGKHCGLRLHIAELRVEAEHSLPSEKGKELVYTQTKAFELVIRGEELFSLGKEDGLVAAIDLARIEGDLKNAATEPSFSVSSARDAGVGFYGEESQRRDFSEAWSLFRVPRGEDVDDVLEGDALGRGWLANDLPVCALDDSRCTTVERAFRITSSDREIFGLLPTEVGLVWYERLSPSSWVIVQSDPSDGRILGRASQEAEAIPGAAADALGPKLLSSRGDKLYATVRLNPDPIQDALVEVNLKTKLSDSLGGDSRGLFLFDTEVRGLSAYEEELFLIADGVVDGELLRFDTRDEAPEPEISLGSSRGDIKQETLVLGDQLFVVTQSAPGFPGSSRLLAYNISEFELGSPLWTIPIGDSETVSVFASQEGPCLVTYFGTSNSSMQCYTRELGLPARGFTFQSDGPTGAVTVFEDHAYVAVPARDLVMSVDLRSESNFPSAVYDLEGTGVSETVVFQGKLCWVGEAIEDRRATLFCLPL